MAIGANLREARQRNPLLGRHDMDNALALVSDIKQVKPRLKGGGAGGGNKISARRHQGFITSSG